MQVHENCLRFQSIFPHQVDDYLKKRADPNFQVSCDREKFLRSAAAAGASSPLVAAAVRGDLEEVKRLSLQPEAPLKEALLAASRLDQTACLEFLARAGARPDCALQLATQRGMEWWVQDLLAAGYNPNQPDEQGEFLLHQSDNPQILERLARAGADLHVRSLKGATPLHHALLSQAWDAARTLVELGADLELEDRLGQRALHIAAVQGQRDWTDYLIAKGANPAALDRSGRNAEELWQSGTWQKSLSLDRDPLDR